MKQCLQFYLWWYALCSFVWPLPLNRLRLICCKNISPLDEGWCQKCVAHYTFGWLLLVCWSFLPQPKDLSVWPTADYKLSVQASFSKNWRLVKSVPGLKARSPGTGCSTSVVARAGKAVMECFPLESLHLWMTCPIRGRHTDQGIIDPKSSAHLRPQRQQFSSPSNLVHEKAVLGRMQWKWGRHEICASSNRPASTLPLLLSCQTFHFKTDCKTPSWAAGLFTALSPQKD